MKQTLKSVDFNPFWRFITLVKFNASYRHPVYAETIFGYFGVHIFFTFLIEFMGVNHNAKTNLYFIESYFFAGAGKKESSKSFQPISVKETFASFLLSATKNCSDFLLPFNYML